MTFLERFKREHPGFNGDDETVMRCACPEDFGYKVHEGARLCAAEAACSDDACAECWNRQDDAAGGGKSQPVCSAAVEKCEEKREPEAFFGNRKAVRQTDATEVDTSSAADAAPSPQGEGKTPPETEDRAVEDARPYGATTGGEEAGADGV